MHPHDRAPEGSTACAARCFCAADDEGDKHTCRTGRTTSLAICSGKSHPGSPIGARLVHGAHRGAADGEHARTRAAHRRQKHALHGERLATRTVSTKRTRATPVVGAASVRWLSGAVSKRRAGRQKRRRRRDRKRRRGAATAMSRAESGSGVVSRKRISITAARWQGWTAALADDTMAMVGECECVRGRARARPHTCRREAARLGIGPPRHRPAQSPPLPRRWRARRRRSGRRAAPRAAAAATSCHASALLERSGCTTHAVARRAAPVRSATVVLALVVAEPTRPLVACAAPTTPSRAAPVRSMTAVLTPAARTASVSRVLAPSARASAACTDTRSAIWLGSSAARAMSGATQQRLRRTARWRWLASVSAKCAWASACVGECVCR